MFWKWKNCTYAIDEENKFWDGAGVLFIPAFKVLNGLNFRIHDHLSNGNRSNKNVQLVSQHCYEISWKAMLQVLHPTHNLSRNKKDVLQVAAACCRK